MCFKTLPGLAVIYYLVVPEVVMGFESSRAPQIKFDALDVLARNLLANPFNCNCHLAWLGDWLRKKRIVTGNPRCQSPYFLKEIPIQDVAIQDFACDDGRFSVDRGPLSFVVH